MNDLTKPCGHLADVAARQLGSYHAVTVAVDEPHWDLQGHQARQGLAGHRPRKHIASYHDEVYSFLAHLVEDRLERGDVPMNVIEGGNVHHITHALSARQAVAKRPALLWSDYTCVVAKGGRFWAIRPSW